MTKKRMRGALVVLLAVAVALVSLGLLAVMPKTAFAAGVGPRSNTYDDPADGIYVSPDGNDATADGSIGAPYKSINTALAAAPPGSTIILRSGTYTEGVNVRVREPNITIKSAKGEWAIIDLTKYDPGRDEDSGVFFDVDSSGGKLQCVEVIGGFYAVCLDTTWEWGIEYYPTRYGASNIIIEDCILHDSRNDVVKVKPNCNNVTIRYCEIYNSGQAYIGYSDFDSGERNSEGIDNVNGANMHVHNNYIHDICSTAVYAKGGAVNALIENNRIERAYAAGVMIGFDTSPQYFDTTTNPQYYENIGGVVRNNLIIDMGWEGIGLYASLNAQVYNNTIINAVVYGTGRYHSPIYYGVATQDWDNPAGCPPSFNPNVHDNVVVQPSIYDGRMIDVRYVIGFYNPIDYPSLSSYDLSGLSGNPTMDYNCYYIVGRGSTFTDNRPTAIENMSFSAWQTHISGDYNSCDGMDPLLDADYVVTNSDCAGRGIPYPLTVGGGSTPISTPPTITTAFPLPGATVGTSYSQMLAASGDVPITWDISLGSLPDGLTLSPAGVISGTPTTAGTSTFTVRATNDAGSDTKILAIAVEAAPVVPVAPTITTSSPLPTATVGTPYSQTLTATGDTPIAWTLDNGNLPDGLSLSAAGLISGTPTAEGDFTFTVEAANITGSDTATFTITVEAAPVVPVPPTITTAFPLPGATVGTSYSQMLAASGDVPITWDISLGSLPDGLTLSPAGVISGTPTTAGTSTFTVRATNDAGSDTKILAIAVEAAPVVPVSPTITTESQLGVVMEGQSINWTLEATGTAPITWSLTSGSLPVGLTLSPEGVLSGYALGSISYNFEITATNSVGSDTKSFTLIVVAEQILPEIITASPLPEATVGIPYSLTFEEGNHLPVTIAWSISSGNLPDGLTLSSAGVLSGTPTEAGSFSFTVNASNGGGTGTKSFILNVNAAYVAPAPPTITTTSLADGTVGVPYSQTLAATGDTPIEWGISSGSLPNGLSLSDAGVISGTPTAEGDFTFTVEAANIAGSDIVSFTITVEAAPFVPTLPIIITASLAGANVGVSYDQLLQATGTEPITWTLDSGDLPDGLLLSSAGLVWGIPTTEGNFTFIVKATNIAGSDTATFTVTVDPATVIPVLPAITTTSLADGTVGEPYNQTLTATGTAPITWSLYDGSLPDGLTLSPAGVISGTPTAAGTFTFIIDAANIAGGDMATFTVTIEAVAVVPVAPTITTTSLTDGTVDTFYSQTLEASGTAPITWSAPWGTMPSWLTLSPAGVLSGTPTMSGSFTFTVEAANDAGSDTATFTLTVEAVTVVPTLPTITTASTLTGASAGAFYSQTLSASGTAPITWTLTSGSLPAGLSLSPAGVISGTPTAAGTFTFAVRASNSEGSDTRSLAITVTSSSPTPYPVIQNFGTFTGSGTATGIVDGPFGSFVRLVLLGTGAVVDPTNYTVVEGSTVITLRESYLKTLANGEYTFRAEFTNGYADLKLVVNVQGNVNDGKGFPQTSDNQFGNAVIASLLSVLLGGSALVLFRLRNNSRKAHAHSSRTRY